ncbi:MAG: hypothetical protein ACREH8_24555 [Opitutaceae bacterium]
MVAVRVIVVLVIMMTVGVASMISSVMMSGTPVPIVARGILTPRLAAPSTSTRNVAHVTTLALTHLVARVLAVFVIHKVGD